MRVLDIDVPERLAMRWRHNLAPERQPFFVTADDGLSPASSQTAMALSY
ncbi:hypothetical protein BH24ACT5_BH24ACT5_15190 [soil metagenome]